VLGSLEYGYGSGFRLTEVIGTQHLLIPLPRVTRCVGRKGQLPTIPVGLPVSPPCGVSLGEAVRAGASRCWGRTPVDADAVDVVRRIVVALVEAGRVPIPRV